MAILIEIRTNPIRDPQPIGTLDADIPGADEIYATVDNGYKQLFTDADGNLDTSMNKLYNEIIGGIIKQVQTHTLSRQSKEENR